jgi:ferredoxin
MRLHVHPGRCEGHGSCFFVDPELFPLDEQGQTAVVDGAEVPAGQEELAREGVQACPVLTLEARD